MFQKGEKILVMDYELKVQEHNIVADAINGFLIVAGFAISIFVATSKTARSGLELYFLVPLTFSICQILFGRILEYSVGGIGIKIFYIIESIRSLLLPVLIVVSNGEVSAIRMSQVSAEMYLVATVIQCVEIIVWFLTIYYFYPRMLKRQTEKYNNRGHYKYAGEIRALGAVVIGLFIGVLVLRFNVWMPALKLFLIKENSSNTKILLENTMLTCVKIVLLAISAQKTAKYQRHTKKYIMGMLCVVFLLLFNSLSYFGTNRVFVLENMVASVLIVWIALPHTRKIITVCVLPVGIALLYTMLVVKQFNLETASEFSSSVISVKSLANTIEEYVNGPWCIAQSYAASRNLTFSTRSGALFADIGNGLGGIADLPIIKSIVSYTNQFHASSAIMKTAFETYDRGQMLSLSAGLFIPFGILGWIVFPIVNFVLARLLIYIEIQSKIVNSLMYKYMYIWMSILLGLSHCYCIETILFCWSKFIFIYWIILKINDIPVKFGKRHRLIQGG